MGCDIHFYVEKRNNAKWEEVKGNFYNGRNYRLFSILANVRNGYGFAGSDTGDGFIPISMPKGLPSDASDTVKELADEWDLDGHSHSYLTVKELMEYDWTQEAITRFMLSILDYPQWANYNKKKGEWPDAMTCSDTSAPKINEDEVLDHINTYYRALPNLPPFTEMTWEVRDYMDKVKSTYKLGNFSVPYVRCSLKVPYYKVASGFIAETMTKLWRLGSPEDVRIVFWFDN